MVWLRDHDLSSFSALDVGQSFMLDNLIFVTSRARSKWPMYSIDTESFSINEEVLLTRDVDISAFNSVVVHRSIAYAWSHKKKQVFAGTKEDGGFCWRLVETSGPKPVYPSKTACGIVEGDSAKFVVISDEAAPNVDAVLGKYELDLDTMIWTRRGVLLRCEETREVIELGACLLPTDKHLHVFTELTMVGGGPHAFTCRTTPQWWLAEEFDIDEEVMNSKELHTFCTLFVAQNILYKVGCVPLGGQKWAIRVYSYDDTSNEWTMVYEKPSRHLLFSVAFSTAIVSGSRIYIIGADKKDDDAHARILDNLVVLELGDCPL